MSCPIVTLVATVCLAPAPTAPDYYPLKVGTKWHYQIQVGKQTIPAVSIAREEETINQVKLVRLECEIDGKLAATEHLASTPEGIFRHRYNGLKCEPPLHILRLPVKKGETWRSDLVVGPERGSFSAVTDMAKVEVPAGQYDAVTVRTMVKMPNGSIIITKYWFAAGVGIVKQEVIDGSTKVVINLEKFEPAGD